MAYIGINEYEKICATYKNGISMSEIAKTYNVDARRIKEILVKNNVEIFNPHKKTKSNDDYIEKNMARFPEVEGKHYVAVLKADNEITFDDYFNNSGVLTRYIKEHFNIEIPSLYKRKKFFHENNYQWHEIWFDIVLKDDVIKQYKYCPYCDWKTEDINNASGAFIYHLQTCHGITREQHLLKYPEDREYLRLVCKTNDTQMETDKKKFVTCAICGKKLKFITNKHLVKHNITQEEYIEKYRVTNLVCESTHNIISQHSIETNKNREFSPVSKAEAEILEYIKENGFNAHKEKIKTGVETDIFIPELDIAIEYNGLYFHSEFGANKCKRDYHIGKLNTCNSNGVKLIQIFEDEYIWHKDIVYNKIDHILKINKEYPKIMGRKCFIEKIDQDTASAFLEKNHIQGFHKSLVHLGAYYDNKLIAVMSFSRLSIKDNTWDLTRFASDNNYICQGVGGKLFKYFVRTYNPKIVSSFADRRWTIDEENNVYIKLGFKFDRYTEPSYRYFKHTGKPKRLHKFNFRKERLNKKYGLPLSMTETEMIKVLKYDRVWDCGLIKYVWTNNNGE